MFIKEELKMNDLKRELNELGYEKNSKPRITICVDFDGTLVEHDYPRIGKKNGRCIEILNKWREKYNCAIILDTMRPKKLRDEAVKWCYDNNLPLFGIGFNPTQSSWTDSRKAYGLFSIDDRNVGCPLIFDGKRPRVDWDKVEEIFEPILIRLNE